MNKFYNHYFMEVYYEGRFKQTINNKREEHS